MSNFMVTDIPLVRADSLIKVEKNTTTYYQAIMKAWDDDYIEEHSRAFARQFKAKQRGIEIEFGRKIANTESYSFENYRDYFKENYGEDTGISLYAPKNERYDDGTQHYELCFYEPGADEEYKWDSEYNRAELPGAEYLGHEYEQLLYPYFAKSIIEQQKIKLRGGLHSELKKRYGKRHNIHSNHVNRGFNNG